MLIESRSHKVTESDSLVTIDAPNTFVREMSIEGHKTFSMGLVCDTCGFIFERFLTSPNHRKYHERVASALSQGITKMNDTLIDDLSKIMPLGDYQVGLHRIVPSLVTPYDKDDYFSNEQLDLWHENTISGLPHFPRTKYYRTFTTVLPRKSLFCEFVVPMFAPRRLDETVVKAYQNRLVQGEQPTALAVSVLDIKSPSYFMEESPEIDTHWCLTHYLLDGHHKMFAASVVKRPVTMVSFLFINESVAGVDDVDYALNTVLR